MNDSKFEQLPAASVVSAKFSESTPIRVIANDETGGLRLEMFCAISVASAFAVGDEIDVEGPQVPKLSMRPGYWLGTISDRKWVIGMHGGVELHLSTSGTRPKVGPLSSGVWSPHGPNACCGSSTGGLVRGLLLESDVQADG